MNNNGVIGNFKINGLFSFFTVPYNNGVKALQMSYTLVGTISFRTLTKKTPGKWGFH